MPRPAAAIAALLALHLLGATAAAAQVSPSVTPAVAAGYLEVDGRRSCSGVLVAPDVVATAGHCVGGGSAGGRIVFHTGAYPGHASVARPAAEVLRHPLYRAPLGAQERMAADVALLRLAAPVPDAAARPIALGDPVARGESLLIASFPGGRGARARERLCPALTGGPRVATLSCVVVSGESGAPVLRLTPEGPRLAAILVATSRAGHQPFAFAVQAPARIRQLAAIHLGRPL